MCSIFETFKEVLSLAEILSDYENALKNLNIPYAVCEMIVALVAVIGNAMVIHVFRKERRLHRRTNYYIVSLAVADFLVGLLGIPFAILASVGLPRNLHACLLTVSLLVVLCTISIFCLVAVSVDRYWAILYPMGYSRTVRTKTAIVIISICWVAGTFVGFLPLLGWNAGWENGNNCLFVKVMDYSYLVFLYFATIITPSLLLALFYAHIYHVILKQLRQIVTVNPSPGHRGSSLRAHSGTMLRVLGAAQKREVKATQNLSIIVLFFIVCWMPLYTINCVQAFCRTCEVSELVMKSCIILSHMNSAGNPLLYAYHLRDFRAALKHFLYSLLHIQEEPVVNIYEQHFRPSLASSHYNYSYQRQQSWRHQSLQSNSNHYIDSPALARQRLPLRNSPYINHSTRTLNRCATSPNMNNTADITANNREMWHIKEVSSTGEQDVPSKKNSLKEEIPKILKSQDNSGQFNNGYIDDGILLSGDDEVFLSEESPPISPAKSTSHSSSNEFPINQILSDNLATNSIIVLSDNIQPFTINHHNISTSSPQLSKNVFLIEESEKNSDISEISSKELFLVPKQKKIEIKKATTLSASTNYLHDNNDYTNNIGSLKKVSNFVKRHSLSSNKCSTTSSSFSIYKKNCSLNYSLSTVVPQTRNTALRKMSADYEYSS
ncbi:histamine H2 receptor [Chrysoperla carnea]|uniref:histamine H2 receptor n=1 Tax=Chrysoperla carnea TaxID=189513 RepID=UPI001D0636E9|nr:histamine H2 receptor [Chrysoperla carnea]